MQEKERPNILLTCRSGARSPPRRRPRGRSIRTCSRARGGCQMSPAETDFAAAKIAASRSPPSASSPCSSRPDCAVWLRPVHLPTWKIQSTMTFIQVSERITKSYLGGISVRASLALSTFFRTYSMAAFRLKASIRAVSWRVNVLPTLLTCNNQIFRFFV